MDCFLCAILLISEISGCFSVTQIHFPGSCLLQSEAMQASQFSIFNKVCGQVFQEGTKRSFIFQTTLVHFCCFFVFLLLAGLVLSYRHFTGSVLRCSGQNIFWFDIRCLMSYYKLYYELPGPFSQVLLRISWSQSPCLPEEGRNGFGFVKSFEGNKKKNGVLWKPHSEDLPSD